MRNVPVDMRKVGLVLCVAKEPKTDRDTGAQRANRSGEPLWTVSVAVRPAGARTSMIEVTIPGAEPQVEIGQILVFTGLEASLWEIEGRAGLAYRAESVAVAPAGETEAAGGAAAESRGARGGAK
ncbi:hypothetical protein [Kitasatospora viridis]|uniref:Uncharacterized protein n=1 Tax=Kitasatospora viridis TaxID=281105 RepID=A0A561TTG3_9ACTN|nr:hypothetical protein [Kitasatospora viridis]TWF90377.1 hypothetical protein FHX73_13421 [Kitasatospora viridis]